MERKWNPNVRYLNEEHPSRLGIKIIPFDKMGRRDLVDNTGLVGGIFFNTVKEIDRMDLRCVDDQGCNMPVISLESRINWALDSDWDVYPMDAIREEDEDIADMLMETNIKVVYCVEHQQSRQMSQIEIDSMAEPAKLYALPTGLNRLKHDIDLMRGSKLLIRSDKQPSRIKVETDLKNVVELEKWKRDHRPKPRK